MSPDPASGPAGRPEAARASGDGPVVLKTFGSGDVGFVSVWDVRDPERWIQSTRSVPVER